MNLLYSDFITLKTNISQDKGTFLVDSQGDICVIKRSALDEGVKINKSHISTIKGVTEEPIETCGTVKMDIFIDDIIITHIFHVVPDRFAIPTDGLIGKDFMRLYQCKLDYADSTLTVRTEIKEVVVSICNGIEDELILPPRCETFRVFKISNKITTNGPYVIPSREILPGVFTANTIASDDSPIIRVINTSSKVKNISNKITHVKNISQFNIYTMRLEKGGDERTKRVLDILKPNFPEQFENELIDLCSEYADIFTLDDDKMTVNNLYTQTLRLNDTEPVYQRNYRLPKCHKDEIERQVENLLKNELIEPSCSNYNSPIILVPKKSTDPDKRWRMCIDYRRLNKKLIADKHPLPRIVDILDSLGNARYFSVIDLFSGFHQVPLHENSRDMTSFSTEKGAFRWKVLPFGLNVSPNSFSRMMQMAFAGLPPQHAFIYIDDVVVIGRTEKHHLSNLRDVFRIFRKCNLKINPTKCQFFRKEVTFLGHLCTEHGVKPDPRKNHAVKNYPRPKDKDEIRRFVAFCNYYRRFINNFAGIAKPLTDQMAKRAIFNWDDKSEQAFQTLKKVLIEPPILTYPDYSKPFLITVDSSNFAAGGVLSQDVEGEDLPISFISKVYKKAEKNKSIIEKELMAIHFAITTFRPYVYGTRFIVRTDHKPLIYLYNLKDPSSKLLRIRLDLDDFDFEIEYIKGKNNVAADALSRILISDLKENSEKENQILVMTRAQARKIRINNEKQSEINETNKSNKNSANDVIIYESSKRNLKIPRIKINTKEGKISAYKNHRKIFDIDISEAIMKGWLNVDLIVQRLEDATFRKFEWPLTDEIFTLCPKEKIIEACKRKLKGFEIILLKPVREIENNEEKIKLIEMYHDDQMFGGHLSRKKVYEKLKNEVYWKGMSNDIRKYIQSCEKCMVSKVKPINREQMTITRTPVEPFEILVVDTVGPLPKSTNGNKYIITMMCELSKFLITVPAPDNTANTTARILMENFILKYGMLKELKTDRGTEFRNKVLEFLCNMMNIEQKFTTAYRHQSVGTIERNHKTMNEYFRSYIPNDLENWEEFLNFYTFCYNTTTHSSLKDKYTPYEIVYGKRAVLPHMLYADVVEPLYDFENYAKVAKYRLQIASREARRLIEMAKNDSKRQYDKKAKPLDIKLGEKVLLVVQPYNKHKPIYDGPFEIVEISHPNVKILKNDNKIIEVHKDRLRKITNFNLRFFEINS